MNERIQHATQFTEKNFLRDTNPIAQAENKKVNCASEFEPRTKKNFKTKSLKQRFAANVANGYASILAANELVKIRTRYCWFIQAPASGCSSGKNKKRRETIPRRLVFDKISAGDNPDLHRLDIDTLFFKPFDGGFDFISGTIQLQANDTNFICYAALANVG